MIIDARDGGTIELAGVFIASRLMHLEIDGRPHDEIDHPRVESGPELTSVTGRVTDTAVTVTWTARRIAGSDVWELGLDLRNDGDTAVTVTRMDPIAARLDDGRWSTLAFHSAWGDEFRPEWGTTDYHHRIGSRSGRSSHGMSPWMGFEREGFGLVVSPAWSGNWHIDVTDDRRVSAGISPWQFATELQAGDSITAPPVVIAIGASRDAAATALTTAIGRDWVPRSPASERLDVEWNHWWPYEDAEVTEQVIWDNAAIAADLGVGVATVDAGWFGAADADSYWPQQRGDWARVNTERFPSGLEKLGEGIRERGVRAGIWIEAEAIGASALLRTEHPEIVALAVDGRRHDPSYGVGTVSLDPDDPTFLGYVCMGSPGGREFVLESMSAVVAATDAEWVKLDFNVDPDAGCTRTDHGHGAHDGLLRHYEGLYSVLDEFRARHPEVVLEACSSGGLRQDLGLARHVHCMFLSDPDYTEHALQVLWGTSLMLPPASILHWSWSQWRGDYKASQLDFSALTRGEFDTLLRAAMLHRFGFSLRLPELSADQLDSLREHIALYTGTIAPFVRDGVLHRLTAQPIRGGLGERAPAFQLSVDDRHIVSGFRLAGGTTPASIDTIGLDPAATWRVTDLATGERVAGGTSIPLDDHGGDVSSWLFLVERD